MTAPMPQVIIIIIIITIIILRTLPSNKHYDSPHASGYHRHHHHRQNHHHHHHPLHCQRVTILFKQVLKVYNLCILHTHFHYQSKMQVASPQTQGILCF